MTEAYKALVIHECKAPESFIGHDRARKNCSADEQRVETNTVMRIKWNLLRACFIDKCQLGIDDRDGNHSGSLCLP